MAYPTGGIIAAGTVTTSVSGTDAEDGSMDNDNTIVITQLPTNASMYYSGTPVSLNQQITGFDPELLSYSGISTGSTSVVFRYAFIDAANKQGSSVNYTLNWLIPIPINLESFVAVAKSCNAVTLTWKVSDAVDFRHFEIERSSNTVDFKTLGIVAYTIGTAHYNFNENVFDKGFINTV